MSKDCPCHSGMSYAHCCERFHKGKLPDNAELLMRSRYSAYALHLADYIMDTTHPKNLNFSLDRKKWSDAILQFSKNTRFEDLKILEFQESGNLAYVTFTAYLSQNGNDATFTEKSRFEKVDGKWLYIDGVKT